ncbi:TIGR00366 family protein [Myxococcus sp. MxC21-1]|nr:TIGR00366 family protein [Myxococcus sp. MxC21-1]
METLVRIAESLGRFSSRFVPSAFAIAVLLTLLTMALATGWAGAAPPAVLDAWGGGFWELLGFSMQMALVMFTGYLLALTGPVRALLERAARVPRTPRGAAAWMAFVSMALAYVNWGLSLVASAMLVRFMVKRRPDVDYRLLVACAYFGLGATGTRACPPPRRCWWPRRATSWRRAWACCPSTGRSSRPSTSASRWPWWRG